MGRLSRVMIILLLALAFVNSAKATYVEMEKIHEPNITYFTCNEIIQFNITLSVLTEKDGNDLSIRDLKIIDTLPPGLSFLAGNLTSTPSVVTFTDFLNGTLLWDFGPGPFNVTPQASILFNVTVNKTAPENIYLLNTAEARYRETVSNISSSPQVSDTVRIIYPILNITKSCTELIHEGDPILYQIILNNIGHLDANASVIDYLPPGILYTPGDAYATSGTIIDNTTHIQWSGLIGNITGSNSITITIPVVDDPNNHVTPHINVVNYTAVSPSAHTISNSSMCLTHVIHPIINLNKTASPSLIHPGEPVVYTYNVTNTGDTTLYNVTVYDSTYMVTLAGPFTLIPGESHQVVYNTNVFSNITNIANATGVDILGLQVNDTDSAYVGVINPSITLNKSVFPDLINPGDLVTYTYNVTNTGNTTLQDLSLLFQVNLIK